ncbi:MFS transporter [Cysteiniphilum halobium]|uniref:MFS transporter n=1 Tax=Cysteiniphilum halobium TaxID=2219059 RepID=UPI000E648259|nr:MFS transporter [Cysteiniphilum halobium]
MTISKTNDLQTYKIIILLSYVCIASLSSAMITPALDGIKLAFNLSTGSLEWIITIFLLGYVFGQLIYAPLSNRYGRITTLRAGLCINLAGIILCLISAYSSSYWLLLIGRLVTALGAAAGLSITYTLIHELLPEEKAKHVLSFVIIAFTAGIAISVFIGGIVTEYLHWYDCFWILLVHGIIMLALTGLFSETLTQKIKLDFSAISHSYLHALKSTQLIIFSLGLGLVSAFSYGYSAAAPLYAEEVLHLTPSQYGLWNIVNMIGMLLSGFSGFYLVKRIGAAKTLIVNFIALIPFLIILVAISLLPHVSPVIFFVDTTILFLLFGAIMGPSSHFALKIKANKAGATSMMSFINVFSASISVAVMGYLPMISIQQFSCILIVFYVITALLITGYMTKNHHYIHALN